MLLLFSFPKSLEEFSTSFQIFHNFYQLLLGHYDQKEHTQTKKKKNKPQGKFQPIMAGKLAEKNSSHHCGKAAGLAPFPFFFSLGTHPHGVTHIQGRLLSLSTLWKGLHRHAQKCALVISRLTIPNPSLVSLTLQHIFSYHKIQSLPHLPMLHSPVSPRQGETLSCVLCQYQVIQSQVHIKNISIPKVKRVQKGVPNARLKPGSANIKSCSSVSVPRAHSAVPNRLGKISPYGLVICKPPSLSQGVSTLPTTFLRTHPIFLASPTSWGLHYIHLRFYPHSFMHCPLRSCLRGL